jgi:hypothetical protein
MGRLANIYPVLVHGSCPKAGKGFRLYVNRTIYRHDPQAEKMCLAGLDSVIGEPRRGPPHRRRIGAIEAGAVDCTP